MEKSSTALALGTYSTTSAHAAHDEEFLYDSKLVP